MSARKSSLRKSGRRAAIFRGSVFLTLAIFTVVPAGKAGDEVRLDAARSRIFREWFLLVIEDQLRRPPNPRWQHRDCAGLIRFAVAEAFRTHDERWKKANSMQAKVLPPELDLTMDEKNVLGKWEVPGADDRSAFVMAAALVQKNSVLVGRDVLQARAGDLVYFDQGEDQHVMVWTGKGFAYHTGAETDREKSIRYVPYQEMLKWKDSRWWPTEDNPNFIGVFRFSFLSY